MSATSPKGRRGRRGTSIALKITAVAAAIAIIFWANQVAVENHRILEAIHRFGYIGLFVVAAISGFNLVVPIPAIGLFPLLIEAGLQPIPSVLVIAMGMTVGDMVGYLLGRAGRKLVEKPQWIGRIERAQERHRLAPYMLLFFWAAFAPLPNEIIVIPMALIGCRWIGVLGAALGGNLIFNSFAAAGFQGLFDFF